MKQKIFLTSAVAMGLFAPAFAEMAVYNTFPDASQGEYMQANIRYVGAATSTNMDGVYEDGATVNAVAEYTPENYWLRPGEYLPADADHIEFCPAGSYCQGIGNVNYNQTSNQGITACPSGYTNSVRGASSNTDCYRLCSGNVTIEHATAVTGNDYYGDGIDTCQPTGCVNGWHIKAGLDLISRLSDDSGVAHTGENSAYIDGYGSFGESNYDGQGAKGQLYYNLTDNNTWAVDYGDKGMLFGQARCGTIRGDNLYVYNNGTYEHLPPRILPSLTAATVTVSERGYGLYCYCNVTGYKDSDGDMHNLSSGWAYVNGYYYWGGSDDVLSTCNTYCAAQCSDRLRQRPYSWQSDFRAALFSTVQQTLATCEANTITINWSDTDAADVTANNAGTATYGSDVRTPVKAQTKKGKIFTGWRFSKPTE